MLGALTLNPQSTTRKSITGMKHMERQLFTLRFTPIGNLTVVVEI